MPSGESRPTHRCPEVYRHLRERPVRPSRQKMRQKSMRRMRAYSARRAGSDKMWRAWLISCIFRVAVSRCSGGQESGWYFLASAL